MPNSPSPPTARLARLAGLGPGAPPPRMLSLGALILANLLPLAGVLAFGWDAGLIILLYWSENVVIGGFNILKIALARGQHLKEHLSKLFLIPFFAVHFGGFCAVHGFFVLMFAGLAEDDAMIGVPQGSEGATWPGPLIFLQLLVGVIARVWRVRPDGLTWPLLALTVSHGVSFVQHFLLGGERRRLGPDDLMGKPYARIVILHIVILAGALPVMLLGSPLPLVVLLVLIKIGVDLTLHLRSHRETGSEEDDATVQA